MSRKGIPPRVIYANPRDKFNAWSALVTSDGKWTVFDEDANTAHRGSSKDQAKGVEDAIKWMRRNGKMS